MAGAEPINDNKWYSIEEARRRQKQLLYTQPTGSGWHWVEP